MRSPIFALCLTLCVNAALSAQTVRTHVLPNYTSPFQDNYTQQMPTDGTARRGDLIAAQWQLFPNPVRDAHFTVNLELTYATDLEARIVTSTGRIAAADRFSSLPEGLATLDFELGDFPAGTYYLNLHNANGALTIPFVVTQ